MGKSKVRTRSIDETLLQSAHEVERNAQKGLPSAMHRIVARKWRQKCYRAESTSSASTYDLDTMNARVAVAALQKQRWAS